MPAPTVVILAAGEGTRMRSAIPKVLHPLCGRPLVLWPVQAALDAGAGKVVVVDNPKGLIADVLPEGVETAIQREPKGTGDAVKAAAELIDPDAPVVILSGDVPLITREAIEGLLAAHGPANTGPTATIVTMVLDDPGSYGRVVRDEQGRVRKVVETKADGDATEEERRIKEVNTGIFCFDGGPLVTALDDIRADNAQGEYYLPDVIPALWDRGYDIAAHVVDDHTLTLGVNDRVDLATVRSHAQRRILEDHMRAGVTIVDPLSTSVDVDVTIGQDTVIEPNTVLRGRTTIGARNAVGPGTTIRSATIGDDCTVIHSVLIEAAVDDGCSVGPFAYLRPNAHLHDRAKAGTFVEIKNSEIGAGSKVPHLSYIGDADVGTGSNLGAATITANYDGKNKHRTTVGDNVRTSVDTTLVAPVTIGDDAYTGAGSVITEDVPPGALGIARERQTNIEGYAERRAGEKTPNER
jgi:bifunctional UDP-N-acetylglucosamine pyrophosphorylase / glucosamine-1-phosphate N-acetyltransferase